MRSSQRKELNDDGTLEMLGRLYTNRRESDEGFVDNDSDDDDASYKNRSTVKSDEQTLFQSIGLDPTTCEEELKVLESVLRKAFLHSNSTDIPQNQETEKNNFQSILDRLKNMLDAEFQVKNQTPTPSDLVPSLGQLRMNSSLFSPGDWVEIEGFDMIWRLDMITRVIKTAPDDYDWNDPSNEGKEPQWNFTYNAGIERHVYADDMRASETGLKLIFGYRPWVWQQWALLKLEEKMRFQKDHQDDFEDMDIQKYASDLWERWVHDPRNADFRKVYFDERIGEKGRILLVNHIQQPFKLMDIMCEESEEWDFHEDDNINVFTYLSLFGSGIILPLFVISVQLAIPIILLREANSKGTCTNGDTLGADVLLAKMMSLAVFCYYSFSVIPDTYANFFNVAGSADTTYSRLLSLRRQLWLQAEDTLLQMIGYRLDIYLSTSYVIALSMLNIFVILYEESAIEIILNALAFAFIARIDEDLAKSRWYDPERRWCVAGAVSMVMQTSLKLRWLASTKLFSKNFHVSEEKLLEACDGDPTFLYNRRVASEDSTSLSYMTNADKIKYMCAKIAERDGNYAALNEYRKPRVYFGMIEKFLGRYLGLYAVFERFTDYRTWSRWEKVLFLSAVPDLESIFQTNTDGTFTVSKSIEHSDSSLVNYYPEEDGVHDWILFLRHFRDVLIFRDLHRTLKAVRNTCSMSVIIRIIDGIFNWSSYIVHIFFPLYLLSGFVENIYNLVTGTCFHPIATLENYIEDWIRQLF